MKFLDKIFKQPEITRLYTPDTILKYPVIFPVATDEFEVLLPSAHKILVMDKQHMKPCMWVLVDEESPKKTYKFKVFSTGRLISKPDELEYIGTVQQWGGDLVWHVFKVKK